MTALIIKSSIYLTVFLVVYYALFSHDKWFTFNRFFLLASIFLSFLFPFITVETFLQSDYIDHSHLLFVQDGLPKFQNMETLVTTGTHLQENTNTITHILLTVYMIGVFLMAFRYIKNLMAIKKLIRSSSIKTYKGYTLVLIDQAMSPFSFGRHIFVQQSAFKAGEINENILDHEIIHIRHYHSFDILFIELLLVFYWFCPVLWLYKTALKSNHEFFVDHEVIKGHVTTEQYCHTILDHTQLQAPFLGSSFNFSLTKKRIKMIYKTQSSKTKFIHKTIASVAILFMAIAIFSFQNVSLQVPHTVGNKDAFTVIIDAGHGGKDSGAESNENDTAEKDLLLALSKAIEAINPGPAVNLIFTRSKDVNLSLKERVKIGKDNEADLLLSLHINAIDTETPGMVEAYYAEKNPYKDLSQDYSKLFANNVKLHNNDAPIIKKANLFVLREASCPAVLLNIGNISNPKDVAHLSSKTNQEKIAKDIIEVINQIKSIK